MIDNKTNSVLFELQKNLEELSSAKIQMEEFRSTSKSVVKGIGDIKSEYLEYLKRIKADYDQRLNLVKNQITILIEQVKNANNEASSDVRRKAKKTIDEIHQDINSLITNITNTIKDIEQKHLSVIDSSIENNNKAINILVETSKETINQGLEEFKLVSRKIEASNDAKIEEIRKLLENYKELVAASNLLTETLISIDFPSKLDALSSKSQLINESIINAKQALEIKINDSQNSINLIVSKSKEDILKLNEQNFEVLRKETESRFNQVIEKIEVQNREIKLNKVILLILLFISLAGLVLGLVK